MDAPAPATAKSDTRSISEFLNRECFCITLDRGALCQALEREVGDPEFCRTFIGPKTHLFSNVPVFLSEASVGEMLRIVHAVEAATRLPGYRDAALSWAPEIARHDFGPVGVFMGYDFHLAADGPRLIEVNTNAGGAFLNALLAKAQRACCAEVEVALGRPETDDFEPAVMRMFQHEWELQKGQGVPRRIAIVDDQPAEQYLYPEFLLAQRFFQKHGIDAGDCRWRSAPVRSAGRLLAEGQPVDLVYNRLVDFSFGHPEHQDLRAAYLDGAVVVTPNPRVHALYADKRNLALLSDHAALRSWGASPQMLADLAGVPHTVLVTSDNAQELWQARKSLFFKPAGGYGSKAVYRGDKVTKGVWAEIIRGGYVAQDFAAPSERMVKLDGSAEARKTDVRLYVYNGQVLLDCGASISGTDDEFSDTGRRVRAGIRNLGV